MLGKGYSKKEVLARLSQTAEALVSVSTVLELARDKHISMPIVEQVELVIEGKMDPKDIAPHLTHMSDTPQGE
jgi:glycerol-3-phosphate dehydrogenase (NAD(P)+)